MEIVKISYEQAEEMMPTICDKKYIIKKWIEKGFVEPKKLTAKEQAINYDLIIQNKQPLENGDDYVLLSEVCKMKDLYEKAIEEAENKNKLSQGSIDWLKYMCSNYYNYTNFAEQILKELNLI